MIDYGTGAPLLIILGGDGQARERQVGGFRFSGNSDVYRLLPDTLAFDQINLGKQFLKAAGRSDPNRYQCVLNLVSDPDQHPRTLERIRKLLRGYRGRVINRPEAVLHSTRDQVAKRLAGIDGLTVPKVLRLRNPKPGAARAAVERAAIDFPLIVRFAGTHTGLIIGLIGDAAELEAACAARGEYILTQFVDYRSADGLFRKFRIWSFGGRTIFRHLTTADEWNIHTKMADRFMFDRPELVDEEIKLMVRPEGDFPGDVHRIFGEIRGRMGLDYFGVDFGFDREGRMVLFECNATMTYYPLVVAPRFAFRQKLLAPTREAVAAMLGLQD